MKLTLEDIARLSGVSRSTVSRVVNRHTSVSPDVRHRVLDTIARTGYAPNLAARSLASNRTGVIGLVIPSRVHSLFEDPYFGRLIQGISRASNRAGTTLSLFLFENEEEEAEIYPRVVASGFVDGVILTASRMGDPLFERMAGGSLPFVVVGRPERTGEVSYVDADNVGGGRLAAEHLCHLGYRRIGYIGAPLTTTAGADRREGFVAGLEEHGRPLDPALQAEGDFSEQGGYRAMQRLVPVAPEAVFVASDTMALGALRALRDAGLDVPGDVAVVGFDGMAASERTTPPLTTVRQPVAATGARAAELLIDLVSGAASSPVVEILPVELVDRESSDAGRRTTSRPD